MLKFAKSDGSNASSTRTPDNLLSSDTVEVLLGISEGPCAGLENGPKDFYLDDTPLVNQSGDPNFADFALQYFPGSLLGHTVKMELGGFASPIQVGQTLAKDTPVTRSGVTTNIDAIDFRIQVQGLYKQTDKGSFTTPLTLKFEIKKHSSATWLPAWISDVSTLAETPVNGTAQTWTSYGGDIPDIYTYDGNRVVTTGTTNPSGTGVSQQIYVNTSTNTVWSWGSSSWDQESTTAGTGYQVLQSGIRLYDKSTVAPAGARTGDLWLTSENKLVLWNGTAWVNGKADNTGSVNQDGIWTIDAKTTSPTGKDFRVFVEPDPNDTWEFRVTKLSDDSGTEISSVVVWESIAEIKRDPMTFTGVTMVRVIGKASDQFTSIPNMSAEYKGRLVKVPSNYNPTTRAYSGVWDGTYNIAWTDNPAYIFQDFVENETFGLSSVFPHVVNKWKIYEWGRYCDVMVERPNGQLRPRWTFNDYIQNSRDAKELANYIAGAAAARYVDDGNGVVDVIIDHDTSPVALFTAESVGEDGFSYSYTDRLTRPNEIIVEFINPALTWQTDKRVVRDADDIAAFGRISENFIAVGCTDEDEALARARRRLIGGLTEKEMVSFTTNRKGRFLSEMDMILVADPQMGRGITGRIKTKPTSTSVTLRDPITLDTGFTYYGTFEVVGEDGIETVRIQITTAAGTVTTLNFASTLPTLPPEATFVVECADHVGVPKAYRILSIEDASGAGEVLRISALEVNRNKYSFIDTGTEENLGDGNNVSKIVPPPTNLKIVTSIRQKGLISTRVATLSWDKPASGFIRQYKLNHTLNGSPAQSPGLQAQTSVEFDNIADGEHVFTVVAMDIFGRLSKPAVLLYNTNGVTPITGQFNFRLVNGTANVFNHTEPTFAWDPITLTPHFDHYEVLVIHDGVPVPIRVDNVGQALTWTYSLTNNKADHSGTPLREFQVGLRAVDQYGNSSEPDLLTVTNPAPPQPANIRHVVDGDALQFTWDKVSDPDFGGTRLYVQTTSGVTVSSENLKFEGTGEQARIPLITAANYWIKIGHFDLYNPAETIFADDELNHDVNQLARDLINDLTGVADQVTDLQTYVDTAVPAAQATADQALTEATTAQTVAEALAEDLISARLAGIDELQIREGQIYLDGKALGTVMVEEQTKTDGMVTDLELIGTRSADGTAFILNQGTVRVGPTESLATRLDLVEARFGGSSSSYLLDQITTTASSAESSATSLNLMGARNGDNSAFIMDTSKVRVNATESFATRLTSVENRFGGSVSSTLLTTATSALSAGNAAVSTLALMGAVVGANTAFRFDETKLQVSNGASLASWVSSMGLTSGQVDARADSRITVSLTPGGAIANSISSVSTTANNAYSSAVIALNALNGNDASVAILTTVNGKITGMKIGGAGGTFGILASSFQLVDPNTGGNPITPFSYANGVVYMPNVVVQNLDADVVTADKVLANNLSQTTPNDDDSSVQITSMGGPVVMTGYVNASGGWLDLDCYINVSGSGGSIGHYFNVVHHDSGTLIGTFGCYSLGGQPHNFATRRFRHRPPAGGNTYKIYGFQQPGGGTYFKDVGSILITDNKTQA